MAGGCRDGGVHGAVPFVLVGPDPLNVLLGFELRLDILVPLEEPLEVLLALNLVLLASRFYPLFQSLELCALALGELHFLAFGWHSGWG